MFSLQYWIYLKVSLYMENMLLYVYSWKRFQTTVAMYIISYIEYRTIIKRSMGHVYTSLTVDRVHKFIIILALLSHLALGAEFHLISGLHKVITVCHILKQWWSWCPVGFYFPQPVCLSITHQRYRFTPLVFHIKNNPPSTLCLSVSFSLNWRLCYSPLIFLMLVTICSQSVWINDPHSM